jgi:hypothetical protein
MLANPDIGVTQIAHRLGVLFGDALSLHPRRTDREYPERLRNGDTDSGSNHQKTADLNLTNVSHRARMLYLGRRQRCVSKFWCASPTNGLMFPEDMTVTHLQNRRLGYPR